MCLWFVVKVAKGYCCVETYATINMNMYNYISILKHTYLLKSPEPIVREKVNLFYDIIAVQFNQTLGNWQNWSFLVNNFDFC